MQKAAPVRGGGPLPSRIHCGGAENAEGKWREERMTVVLNSLRIPA